MKTHRFDIISFLAGLVFTGIGLLFLIPADVAQLWDVLVDWGAWFWPAVFLVVGGGIIAAALLPRKTAKVDDSQAGADDLESTNAR